MDRDRANAVGLGRVDVAGGVADKRDGRAAREPAAGARIADGKARQAAAVARHFGECAEAEKLLQAGALQLLPSDAREVARNQRQQRPAPLQAA